MQLLWKLQNSPKNPKCSFLKLSLNHIPKPCFLLLLTLAYDNWRNLRDLVEETRNNHFAAGLFCTFI